MENQNSYVYMYVYQSIHYSFELVLLTFTVLFREKVKASFIAKLLGKKSEIL